jgi:hypothetical protein
MAVRYPNPQAIICKTDEDFFYQLTDELAVSEIDALAIIEDIKFNESGLSAVLTAATNKWLKAAADKADVSKGRAVMNNRRYKVIGGNLLHGLPRGETFNGYLMDEVVYLDGGDANHAQCDPADVQFVGFNLTEPSPAIKPDPDDLATIGTPDDLPMP